MFSEAQLGAARDVIERARAGGRRIAVAESCTGGLIAALLTEIPGASDVFDRGFVTYSNEAKTEMLGIEAELIRRHGAVSSEVAKAMAEGALRHSPADAAVAVTGIAGPGGGTAAKPVGLIYLAASRRCGDTAVQEHRFGDIGRGDVRSAAAVAALELLGTLL